MPPLAGRKAQKRLATCCTTLCTAVLQVARLRAEHSRGNVARKTLCPGAATGDCNVNEDPFCECGPNVWLVILECRAPSTNDDHHTSED
eukprot:4582444-Prymnesium_polylepis.2